MLTTTGLHQKEAGQYYSLSLKGTKATTRKFFECLQTCKLTTQRPLSIFSTFPPSSPRKHLFRYSSKPLHRWGHGCAEHARQQLSPPSFIHIRVCLYSQHTHIGVEISPPFHAHLGRYLQASSSTAGCMVASAPAAPPPAQSQHPLPSPHPTYPPSLSPQPLTHLRRYLRASLSTAGGMVVLNICVSTPGPPTPTLSTPTPLLHTCAGTCVPAAPLQGAWLRRTCMWCGRCASHPAVPPRLRA